MSDQTYNREQVDAITAPWLELCKQQETRVEELEAAIDTFLNTGTAGDDGDLLVAAAEKLAKETGYFDRMEKNNG
jgi:hypothetical protein